MKQGETITLPKFNEDGSDFEGRIRKVFKDGSVWVEGKEKDNTGKNVYIGTILSYEELKALEKKD